ncbi:hypothetical protein M758_10G021800 [Ceratodon purpureus]|nr:hypothetical protein M758_10G021800 [Ceratodon purpureus]
MPLVSMSLLPLLPSPSPSSFALPPSPRVRKLLPMGLTEPSAMAPDASPANAEDHSHVEGGVVALGKFEGLHLGHRALAERASELGTPVMLSLSGMAEVLGWEPKLPVVASDDRARVLESWGKHCRDMVPKEHVLEFAKIRKLSPEQFVEKLANELKVKGAVAGADYRFGFRASGKALDLVEFCKKYGLESAIVEPVMDSKDAPAVDGCSKDKGQVSTTRIRKALAEGDMKRVAELLGRNHRLYIEVKDSVQKENVISFPIANVLNQPPTVGSYECSLPLEGINDVVQVRIQETEISLELQDSNLVNKITQQSRIALDFLA